MVSLANGKIEDQMNESTTLTNEENFDQDQHDNDEFVSEEFESDLFDQLDPEVEDSLEVENEQINEARIAELEENETIDDEIQGSDQDQEPEPVQEFTVMTANQEVILEYSTEKTSKSGHLRNSDVDIFKELDSDENRINAIDYLDQVLYIKLQAKLGDDLYYLISELPSSERGVIGWIHESDIRTHRHSGINTISRTLIVNGNGQAFEHAWGGKEDLVYDLNEYIGSRFFVNKTERVGNNVWYRGILDGEQVFIHESYVMDEIKGSSTSRLGHIKNSDVTVIGRNGGQLSNETINQYLEKVLYIKSETTIGRNKYYLISAEPSATRGVIGWINQRDISVHEHKGIDSRAKTLYTTGSGLAFTKAWGGDDDVVFDLSNHKGKPLIVNKTERVGKNTWYRGHLAGEQVFIHSAFLESRAESPISRLGHINNKNVNIYNDYIEQQRSSRVSGTMLQKVYYIKKQARFDGQLFYLISEEPSATKGTIGWVNEKDMRTHPHSGLDTKSKTFYINGTGSAYSKAWGGNQDAVYDLSKLSGRQFNVHKTERVGNNTWYRGDLDGERVFIHSAYLSAPNDNSISRLGHLNRSTVIYQEINNLSLSSKPTVAQLNKVYYIKSERVVNNDIYYLISEQPSNVRGTVGWVKSTDMRTHPHSGVDTRSKVYAITGTGNAYTKAWGGSKDLVFSLSDYAEAEFRVNKTERVGNNTWYRGHLDGKQIFIHEAYVNTSNVWYQSFDVTLNGALATQMGQLQQTDMYRNNKAYILKAHVSATTSDSITADGVRLRSQPNFNDNVITQVNSGTTIEIIKEVSGATHAGSTVWYEIKYNNQTLYVHSSLAKRGALVASTNRATDVRMSMSSSGHVFGRLSANTSVNIINESGSWYEIRYQGWRNPTRADVLNYLNPNNNDMYQHLLLTESAGVSATSVNRLLSGKGILHGRGQAFINASLTHSVNEVYLISHAILETGHGSSELAQGIEVGENSSGNLVLVTGSNRNNLSKIKKVYNMFGIGAVDGDAKRGGAIRAYREGWDTPDKAIVGGARFIGQRYIHNSHNQNTLYKMRWNPANPGYPQYATDIAWAVKQVGTIKSMYSQLDSPSLRFLVPIYK